MMHFFKYSILLFLVNFNLFETAYCQPKQAGNAVLEDIFKDLPINDPSILSAIEPGQTGDKKIKNYISVTAVLNKQVFYEGEPILLTYELLSALKSSSSILKYPEIDGAMSLPLDPDNEFPKFRKKDGISFSVFIVKQLQLIPYKPGEIQIGAIAVNNEITYIKASKSLSYSGVSYSKPTTLKILALPQIGKPLNFSGAVGNFEIKAIVDKDTFSKGENNKLIIEINGSGNLFSLKAPSVLWPSGINNFDSSEKSEIDEKQFPMQGNKIISIPFIADQTGDFIIPSIEINFFDPQTNNYRKAATTEIHIFVTPAVASSRTINSEEKKGNSKSPFSNNLLLLIITGVVVVFGSFIIKKIVANRRSKEEEFKKAMEIEKTMEKDARIEKANERNIYTNIEKLSQLELDKSYVLKFKQTLMDYLYFKFKIESQLSEEVIKAVKDFDIESRVRLSVLLDECDLLLYNGILPDQTNRKKLLSSLNDLVTMIDKNYVG